MTTEEIKEEEVIVDENNNDQDQDQEEEKDYATLYEQEKLRADKYEGRFKKTAKELNEMKKTSQPDSDVSELVSKQIGEQMFYMNNPVAKEFEKEIKEVQSKNGMTPEDAYTFYLAKNKPELLAKKSEVGVDGIPQKIEGKKDPKDMTYEELRPNQKVRG